MTPDAIRSREHLLHMLAEASELEHNLLCSYLYAAFSLKEGLDEDLLSHELEAIGRWRSAIMAVCMEEMAHLAQVANLMIAVGSRPHFDRPNLPVAPGYHPARIQVALRRFDLETLDHFIFLERPEASSLQDAQSFTAREPYERRPEIGHLMPSAPDYATIGEFYGMLEAGLANLAEAMGSDALFCGPLDHQLRSEEIGLDHLLVVKDLASAQRALQLIVVQGEGSPDEIDSSHFRSFLRIRAEFLELRAARPAFDPSRPVARNPVMRRPTVEDRVHIEHEPAASVLDVTNAAYGLMLRCLASAYDVGPDRASLRKALLGGATGLMRLLSSLAAQLTRLPAIDSGAATAGMTFTMLRSTEGLAPDADIAAILDERLAAIAARLPSIGLPAHVSQTLKARVEEMRRGMTTREGDRSPG